MWCSRRQACCVLRTTGNLNGPPATATVSGVNGSDEYESRNHRYIAFSTLQNPARAADLANWFYVSRRCSPSLETLTSWVQVGAATPGW